MYLTIVLLGDPDLYLTQQGWLTFDQFLQFLHTAGHDEYWVRYWFAVAGDTYDSGI